MRGLDLHTLSTYNLLTLYSTVYYPPSLNPLICKAAGSIGFFHTIRRQLHVAACEAGGRVAIETNLSAVPAGLGSSVTVRGSNLRHYPIDALLSGMMMMLPICYSPSADLMKEASSAASYALPSFHA